MGEKRCAWAVMLVMFLAMLGRFESAGAPAPSPSAVDCTSAIFSLADCLDYVQEGSKAAKPQGSCCSSLKKVVKTEVSCLCEVFKSSASFGVSLNMTRALALPSACSVSTPPVSRCNITVDTSGGAHAPSPSSQFFKYAPLGSPIAAARGSVVGVPSPSPTKASAATFQIPVVALLINVLAVTYLCF